MIKNVFFFLIGSIFAWNIRCESCFEQKEEMLLLTGRKWDLNEAFERLNIEIQQNPNKQEAHEVNTGRSIWDSSITLADHFLDHQEEYNLEGKKILEIGAGTGLLGISLAKNNKASVTLTDLEPLLSNIEKNAQLNQIQVGIEELNWENPKNSPQILEKTFDIIVASDIIWVDHLVGPLVETLQLLIKNENIEFYLCHQLRSENTVNLFFKEIEDNFNFEVVPQKGKFQAENITIYKITKKTKL